MSKHHESTDDEIVFVPKQRQGGNSPVYHSNEDCPHLEDATGVRPHTLSNIEHMKEECRFCSGEADTSSDPDFSYFESLQEAAK